MKSPTSAPSSLSDWLTQHAPVAALLGGSPEMSGPVDAALVPTLDLLQHLRVDSETLAATLAYELRLPTEKLPASLQALIDGQREAGRVWKLYSEKGQGVAPEGLRRLLLAIIRDLRVVLDPAGAAAGADARRGGAWRSRNGAPGPAHCRHPRTAREPARHLAAQVGAGGPGVPFPATGHLQAHRAGLLDEKRGDREAFIERMSSVN
jgi:GTP pyrophosphokinase